jgi:hypothetical protein
MVMPTAQSPSHPGFASLRPRGQPNGDVNMVRHFAGLGMCQRRYPHHPELSQPRVAITPRPDPKLIGALLQSGGKMRAVMLSQRVWTISPVSAAPSRPSEIKDNAKDKYQRKSNKNKKYPAYAPEGCTHSKPLRTITEQKCTLIGGISKGIHGYNLGCTPYSLRGSNARRHSPRLGNPLQYSTSRCPVYKISIAAAPVGYISRHPVKIESNQLEETGCDNAISPVSTKTIGSLRFCGGRS